MKNMRAPWGARMGQQQERSEGGGRQSRQSMWQSRLQAQQFNQQTMQRTQRMRMLRTLDLMKERGEKRSRALANFRNRLEKGINDQPYSPSGYGSARSLYEGEQLDQESTDPYSTTAVSTDAAYSTPVRQPSSRTLFSIFDELKSRDFDNHNHPKVSVVNDMLEDKGYGRADKEAIDAASEQWLSEHKGGSKKAAPKRASKKRARKTAKKKAARA